MCDRRSAEKRARGKPFARLWGDLLGPSCPKNSHASCTALSLIAFLCVYCCLCAALCGCVGETKHHGVAAFVCSVAGAQREGGTLQVVDGVIAISWQRVWIVSMKAAVVAALVLSSSCCATASCHSGWGDRRSALAHASPVPGGLACSSISLLQQVAGQAAGSVCMHCMCSKQ